jgi:mRNA interferase MazF
MSVNRGDVVLVPVPDTSGNPGKVRPALVVSSDHNNQRLQDVIVAVITGTTKRAFEATQLLIELATPVGIQSGLLADSVVKCERLHAILQSHIRRTVGSLPVSAMLQINDCLKAALAIP